VEVPVMFLKWRNGAKYRIRSELARSIQNGKPRPRAVFLELAKIVNFGFRPEML
jgi:hypothetical protein